MSFVALAASGQDESRPIWEQEAMLIYSDTSAEFNRLRTIGRDNPRLSLYTQALDILHGKIEAEEGEEPYEVAQRYFRMLVADNDHDAIGVASAYYLARIMQSNPVQQDVATAKRLYKELYDQHPDRFFGQMAFIKYATLEIYDDDGYGTDVAERIQNLEPMVSKITIPEVSRNLHRVMGEAYVGFELEARPAFDHLVRAYELGLPVQSIRIDVLALIGRLGEEVGENARALKAYDELLLIAPKHPEFTRFAEAAHRLRQQVNGGTPLK